MWPLNERKNDSQSSLKQDTDEVTEEQIQKFFEDASASTTLSTTPRENLKNLKSAAETKFNEEVITASEEGKEEPCSLQYYFDEFFMCYTPKSQARNWYRFGEKKDCSERWRDFKWCMSTRMTDDENSQELLARRKSELLDRVRSRPNSESIWDIREKPLTSPFADAGTEVSGQDSIMIS